MRKGFTTGSCAAAAAKAATYMLLRGEKKEKISIETPAGEIFTTDVLEISMGEHQVSCAVMKDGGDDPDVTSGCLIFAKLTYSDKEGIQITGGKGVGRVTKPGLDQPVGEYAINSVPRKMITKEVAELADLLGYSAGLCVTIWVPEGEAIAAKTFNPRLGIEGGISILGSSGIVEPMSAQALIDTISVELRQKRALGNTCICLTPGNYGLDFMKEHYRFDLEKAVKCSNFIGDSIDLAKELGFEKLLLVGHIGKLVKLAAGIMNTHSKVADGRIPILVNEALKAICHTKNHGIDEKELFSNLWDCLTTEEALRILKEAGILEETMAFVLSDVMFYLQQRAGSNLNIECIIYSKEEGLLGKSKNAEALLIEIRDHSLS